MDGKVFRLLYHTIPTIYPLERIPSTCLLIKWFKIKSTLLAPNIGIKLETCMGDIIFCRVIHFGDRNMESCSTPCFGKNPPLKKGSTPLLREGEDQILVFILASFSPSTTCLEYAKTCLLPLQSVDSMITQVCMYFLNPKASWDIFAASWLIMSVCCAV